MQTMGYPQSVSFVGFFAILIISVNTQDEFPYTIIEEIPHDSTAFTQGLAIHENQILRSKGLYGSSGLSKLNITTGLSLLDTSIESSYFGEGITVFDNRVIMLTWRARVGLVYNLDLQRQGQFNFSTTRNEGWGITHNGTHLIVSDGSEYLHFWDPYTLEEVGRIRVMYNGFFAERNLNELEYISKDNVVLANVWYRDYIAVIDISTGVVLRRDNFAFLKSRFTHTLGSSAVLNGIAYDPSSELYYITGKLWSKIFVARKNNCGQPTCNRRGKRYED
eukprot:m.46477 g.46477  ORF g.46477 m.46477 type:complete len:277 (-) comp10376_c0_seq1:374-1204(-)